jgi:ketosteroid isomerase-like protein
MSNAERLVKILEPVFPDGETVVDEALVERMVAALEPMSSDDFTVVMRGDEQFEATYTGRQAAIEAWAGWLEVFSQVRFEIESVEEIGDNVLTLARQVGRTRHGDVELEQPSAAVWKFRGEQLARVEFHLDREAARRSARSPAPASQD